MKISKQLLRVICYLTLFFALSLAAGCGDDDDDDDNDAADVNDDADDDDTGGGDDDVNDDADDDVNDDVNDDADDDDGPTRSFAMSAAPFMFDVGDDSVTSEFGFQGLDGMMDVISMHTDNFFGIPWEQFGGDAELPQAWVNKMAEIKTGADALGVDIYLSLTPLSGFRNQLAAKASDEDGELVIDENWVPGCYDFENALFAEEVKTAYKNYVRWMVDYFNPTYLTHGIEVNMYEMNCPDQYDSLIGLLNEVYDREKALNSDLPVFATFTAGDMWYTPVWEDCYLGGRECLRANLTKNDDMKTDLFGISAYPVWLFNELEEWPEDFFTAFAEETGLPVAFGETGWSNRSVTIPFPNYNDPCQTVVESSDQLQIQYMEYLFEKAQDMNAQLVVWWSIRDYLPEDVLTSCPCEATGLWCVLNEAMYAVGLLPSYIMWGGMGVMDYELADKSIAATWDEWLARPIEQSEE